MPLAAKLDVKRSLERYRARRGQFRLLEVPDANYLMIDGQGDPNTDPRFASALAALYPLAYTVKFAARERYGRDYVVPPLEGLWWADGDDMAVFTEPRDKSRWRWTLLNFTPAWVEADLIDQARDRLDQRRDDRRPERLDEVRWSVLSEGQCVQTLHVGSFDEEGPVLARMHDQVIPDHGMRMAGHHHEIYLSDLRRTPPNRQRTILRQPVEPD